MKFLLITLEYFPFHGGVAKYYTKMKEFWPSESSLEVLSSEKKLLSSRGPLKWRRAFFSIKKMIKRKKVDYLIIGQILPFGSVAYFLYRFFKTPYAIIFHGLDFSLATRNSWKRFITKKILKSADKIISANSYTAQLISDFLGSDSKIKVVNPGVETEFKSSELIGKSYENEAALILFSLGRLVRRKGFDQSIKAIGEILKQDPSYQILYLIAGQGEAADYLKDLAQEVLGDKWENYIKFLGSINEEEKWAYLSLSDIFIMPARNIAGDFEGFGIVYLEANLAKKPVIAGDSGGVRDAVVHNLNGLVVDPENSSDIAQAILKLGGDKKGRELMGQKAYERVLSDFQWPRLVKEIYNFLNN